METTLTGYEILQEIYKDREKQEKKKTNREFYENKELLNYGQYAVNYITNYVLSTPPTIQGVSKKTNDKINNIISENNFYIELIKALKTLLIEGEAYFLIYDILGNVKIEKQDRYNKVIIFRNAQNKKIIDLIIRYGYYKGKKEEPILWAEQYYKKNNYIYKESFIQSLNGALEKEKEEVLRFKEFPIIELNLGTTYIDRIKPICEEIGKISKGYAGALEKLRLYIIKIINTGITEREKLAFTLEDREKLNLEIQQKERGLAKKIQEEDLSTFFIDDKETDRGNSQKADVSLLEIPDKTASLREGIKDLEEKLCRIGQIPSLSDENFGGNQSGVALKYKTMGLKQLKNEITRELTRGILDILKALEVFIGKDQWEIVFHADDIDDFQEKVKNIVELYNSGLIDRETALNYLRIGNTEKIIENLKKEELEELGYDGLKHEE